MRRTVPTILALACGAAALPWAAGCSTAAWYDAVQITQQQKCTRLESAEDRRRCREATQPDKDAYDRARDAARGVR